MKTKIKTKKLVVEQIDRHVITTGSDGDIRIWNGVDDDDPDTQCVCESILYHAFYEKRILTSTDLNTVQAYTYPEYNRDGTEFRFTSEVTCIKVNAKVCLTFLIEFFNVK